MSVTLHTNVGDLKIEVFCESVPKTAEVMESNQPCCSVMFCRLHHADATLELFSPVRVWLL